MKNFIRINPKKRFGQNFLEDQILLDELANLMQIENYDRFVEIGPGTGNLTQLIVDRSDFCTSIEIDKNLISFLDLNHLCFFLFIENFYGQEVTYIGSQLQFGI